MEIDGDVLRARFDLLHDLAPDKLELHALLEEVVHAATDVFGFTGAGILLVDEDRALRSVTAADAAGGVLERVQEHLGEGPCVDSYVTGHLVGTADVGTDGRWPRVGPRLAAEGVRAVLGIPVRLGGGPVGTLNVTREVAYPWSDSERQAIERLGRILETLLHAALVASRKDKLARQLQYALEYRIPIERAIGYLMAVRGVDAVTAFEALRSTARNRRARVADLAQDILSGRGTP